MNSGFAFIDFPQTGIEPGNMNVSLLDGPARIVGALFGKAHDGVHPADYIAAPALVAHQIGGEVGWLARVCHQDKRRGLGGSRQACYYVPHNGGVVFVPTVRFSEGVDEDGGGLERKETGLEQLKVWGVKDVKWPTVERLAVREVEVLNGETRYVELFEPIGPQRVRCVELDIDNPPGSQHREAEPVRVSTIEGKGQLKGGVRFPYFRVAIQNHCPTHGEEVLE